MEVHVYLHANGGFPNIYKNAYPAFIGGRVIVYEDRSGEAMEIADYKDSEVFRVDVLMETE